MGNDYSWTVNKIQEYLLTQSPYLNSFKDIKYNEQPEIVYKKFTIKIKDEYNITICCSQKMTIEESIVLGKNLNKIVDGVDFEIR